MNVLNLVLAIWNFFVMLFYALDKSRAIRGVRRIRESTLLILAFFMGGIGAMFGMILFNHKTSKIRFRILVPLFGLMTCSAHFFMMYEIYGGNL